MARKYRLGPGRRAVNSVVTLLIRVGAGGRANYLLTTVGRRTGQPRTTPVTLIKHAGERWLVSPYGTVGWVYNVRAHPQITLRRGHQTEVTRAEEVPPEVADPSSSSTSARSGSPHRTSTPGPRTRSRSS